MVQLGNALSHHSAERFRTANHKNNSNKIVALREVKRNKFEKKCILCWQMTSNAFAS